MSAVRKFDAVGAIHDLKAKNNRGKYVARVWYYDGEKRKTLTASGDSRAEARAALEAKLGLRATGLATGVSTMNDLWDAYAAEAVELGRPRASTVRYYREAYRARVRPVLGKRAVQSLDRAELVRFVKAEPSPTRAFRTLHALLRFALDSGVIDADPTNPAFRLPRPQGNPTALPVETLAEMEAAFVAAETNLTSKRPEMIGTTSLTLTYVLMRDSGLRVGESLALRKMDYTPATGQVWVRGTMTTEGGRQEATKTAASFRKVILPEHPPVGLSSRELLAEAWKAAPTDDAPLIPGRGGKFISPHNLRRRWRDALAATGNPALKDISPHALRHTAATTIVNQLATRAEDKNAALWAAAGQLGHTGIEMLRKHYLDAETMPAVDVSHTLAGLNPAVLRQKAMQAAGVAVLDAYGLVREDVTGHYYHPADPLGFDYAAVREAANTASSGEFSPLLWTDATNEWAATEPDEVAF